MKSKAHLMFKLLPILSLSFLIMATCFAGRANAQSKTIPNTIKNVNTELAYFRVYYAHPHWRYAPRARIYRGPGYYRHSVVCKKRCFRNRFGNVRCVRGCY